MAEGIFKQLALLFFEMLDAFFDRALRDHAIYEDAPILPDTVHTVDGLIFDCGIPPRVEQEDIVRRMQCNASAPRA
jgi:hypothetical protein